MKTTLTIDDGIMRTLKKEAARRGQTMSSLVETALRNFFRAQRTKPRLKPLPSFHGGGTLVDISDREALYQAMEGR